jgi:hypothetical protein
MMRISGRPFRRARQQFPLAAGLSSTVNIGPFLLLTLIRWPRSVRAASYSPGAAAGSYSPACLRSPWSILVSLVPSYRAKD